MINTIIFDFFGVIRTDALKAWLKTHHVTAEDDFWAATQAVDRGDIDQRAFFERLGTITGKQPDALFAEMEATAGIDQEVVALIGNLANKYKLGLLSNSSADFLRSILKQQQLEQYFKAIIISSEAGVIKPDPRIFELALQTLGSSPQETLFIDDSPTNAAAAKKLGIDAITYANVQQLTQELQLRQIAVGR